MSKILPVGVTTKRRAMSILEKGVKGLKLWKNSTFYLVNVPMDLITRDCERFRLTGRQLFGREGQVRLESIVGPDFEGFHIR